MADKRSDKPEYKTIGAKIGGAFGRDADGNSAIGIFGKEAFRRTTFYSDDLGEFALKSVFFCGILGNMAIGLGSLVTTEVTNPGNVKPDPTLSQVYNSGAASYTVAQELDSRVALIRHGDRYEIYRLETRPANYHLARDGENDVVHRWDLVENPALARMYALEIADSYAKAIQMMQDNPDIPVGEYAPVTYSYGAVSSPYLEQNGEVYRDSRRGSPNRVGGEAIAQTLLTQQRLWEGAAAAITPESYTAAQGDIYRINENDMSKHRFLENFKNYWGMAALGWLALSLGGAGLATAREVKGSHRRRSRRYE